MKKLHIVLFLILTLHFVSGQEMIKIQYTATPPEIDGIEEELWDLVEPAPIEKDFTGESPTVTAYWKALWDSSSFYVLLSVEDDDHYPAWKSGGSWYEYDQPELYFDLNSELRDGLGASDAQGHWQVQPGFEENGYGVPATSLETDFRPFCTYCYVLTGENYVWEYVFDYDDLTNKAGETMSIEKMRDLDSIGFDVTIIDQDEGVTDSRQRKVWSNTGEVNENYGLMDDAGRIILVDVSVSTADIKSPGFSIYPNPVRAWLNINADFDRIMISNLLGQNILTLETVVKRINLGNLDRGIYFVRVYRDGNSIGMKKIIKE